MHCAIREFEDIDEIISQNPDLINYPDRSGTSPLQMAVRTRNQKAVEILLLNGAEINARSRKQTCLEEAITLWHTRIAGLLLGKGAQPGLAFHAMGKAAASINKPYQLSYHDEDHYPGYRMGDPKWHDCMNLWRENLTDHFKGYFE
ncbi:MAG: ankyrin repeat domain-containing protein, partial [Candidatus Riflebacteria bacterium]